MPTFDGQSMTPTAIKLSRARVMPALVRNSQCRPERSHSGSLARAVELAEKHDDIYAGIGVHPHDARLFDDGRKTKLVFLNPAKQASNCLGEIGLDLSLRLTPPAKCSAKFLGRQLRLCAQGIS